MSNSISNFQHLNIDGNLGASPKIIDIIWFPPPFGWIDTFYIVETT